MKHVIGLITLSVAVGALGCRGGELGGDDPATPDAGVVALPDATVIGRFDSGPIESELPIPTLTAVSPRTGPETGGTRVTLRGTSFLEPAQVFFGSVEATSVVVLDSVNIAATTPPGTIGRVTVRLITPGGTAELPDGFAYRRDLRVTAVEPARIPEEGGVAVTIRGKGFDADTVLLMDRRPLIGTRLVDAQTIEGIAPALEPGRPEIWAVNPSADVRRADLLYVYATPEVRALAPGYGPVGSSAAQAIEGDGLEQTREVTVGAQAASDLVNASGERLSIVAPAMAQPGAYDVTVDNGDASATLPAGYIAYDPARVGLEILGVVPNRASSLGGEVVAIVGYGFAPDARVQIGGIELIIDDTPTNNAIVAIVPPSLFTGPNDVIVFTRGSTLTATGALTVYDPIEVRSINPTAGASAGGTLVTIEGFGFPAGAEVLIGDVPLEDVMITGDRITARIVAGAHGPQDVVVRGPDGEGRLVGGFTFREPFAVVSLAPAEGSIAGNTFVTVIGRGFDAPATVEFDGAMGDAPNVENGSVISVRSPALGSGWVDIDVGVASQPAINMKDAFMYYDPTIVTGGAWGGSVEGSVNVAVLNIQSGRPIPGFVVQLGNEGDLSKAGVTNEDGLVTISGPTIRGAQTVSAGQNDFEHVTYMDLDARNLTVLASAHPASANPDDPISPCPTGVPGPVIRGKVFKFKSSLDPVTRPGWRPVARITYTDRNVFSANPAVPPEQVDFVFTDGGQYEILPQRVGTIAVYAILGDFNEETQEFIPRKMGIVRQVPAAAETVTENINIALDIDLDRDVEVRLDNPPQQIPGPTTIGVVPYLNLGSEGVIRFAPQYVMAETVVQLTGLPNLAGAQFFYMAGSWTTAADGSLRSPQSVTLAQSGEETEEGLDVGPFLAMPENVSPKQGDVAYDGRLSWDTPGTTPDIASVFVVDVKGVSGCCCMDGNMNGQCEETEPVQCGGTGVQFTRWSIFGKGGLQSYEMPPMPPGVQAFEPPRGYFWVMQQAIAPRFNYDEFIYNQFSPYFWKSWTVWFSQFVAKEETR